MTVWGRKNAFNVQKVLWFAGELDLEYRHIEVGGSFGGLNEPDFLAKNPHGRIPLVDDGGTIVWESHAILRYLAAQYGGAAWWPADPAVRSLSDRWMDWAQTRLQPDFLTGVFWGWYRTPEAERDMEKVGASVKSCARHAKLLDDVLADRRFIAGDDLTLADIAVGTHLFRYLNIAIDRPSVPRLIAYYERLTERPAYRATVMLPFDDLYGRLDY